MLRRLKPMHRSSGAESNEPDSQPSGAEARLVERARCGDRDAFADLIRIHRPRVERVARRLVGNPEDADDVAQDCFVRAWMSLARLEHPERFAGWLQALLIHAAHDLQRRRGRRPEAAAAELLESLQSGSAGRVAGEQERRRIIDAAIAALPTRLRTVLVLRALEGQSFDAIAQATGVRSATVRTQLVDARRALRRLLVQALGESLEGTYGRADTRGDRQ